MANLISWVAEKIEAGRIRAKARAEQNVFAPIISSTSSWGVSQTPTSAQSLVERNIGWVYVCAKRNAISLASVPLRLYVQTRAGEAKAKAMTKAIRPRIAESLQRSPSLRGMLAKALEIEEVLEHPFLDLMTKVNNGMNEYDFKVFTAMSWEITGNAYVYVPTNGMGPYAMYPLLPQYMKIIADQKTGIGGYVYGSGPNKLTFKPDEIMQFRFVNLASVLYGASPLEAVLTPADLAKWMNEYEASLVSNNAVPDILLTTDQPMGPEAKKQLLQDFDNRYRGPNKRGKAAVATGMKIEKIGFSPREMNFLMGRKMTREEIAAAYDVPLSMLTTDDVNLANAKSGEYVYMKYAILPRCRFFEQKINEWLLPKFDESGRLFCAFDNPVPEDAEDRRSERQNRLSLGMTTINEEREQDNMEPVEWGGEPILPFTMAPLSAPKRTEVPEPFGMPPKPPKDEDEEEEPKKPEKSFLGHSGRLPGDSKAKARRSVEEDEEEEEMGKLSRTMKALFHAQRRDVLSRMPIKTIKVNAPDLVMGMFSQDEWNNRMGNGVRASLRRSVKLGGDRGMRKVELFVPEVEEGRFTFMIDRPEVQEFIERYPYKFAAAVNDKTADDLRKTLGEGIEAGENMYDLRKRVQTVYADYDTYRLDRIARTETIRALSAGQEMAWAQSEVVTDKEWNAADDCCDFCSEMNGTVVELGIPFAKGTVPDGEGNTMDISYEDTGVGHPPLHPNCRCAVLPVIREE